MKENKLPRKPKNLEKRTREYLTEEEIDRLLKAARGLGRYGHRDYTMLLISYTHGLRVSELIELKWEQVDFNNNLIHVNRSKNGLSSVQPLRTVEVRALKKLQKETKIKSPFIFLSERDTPLTPSSLHKIIVRAGKKSGIDFPVHMHMLRHSCGYKLANKGVDTRALQQYLGHRNIQNTVLYSQLSSKRFEKFWDD